MFKKSFFIGLFLAVVISAAPVFAATFSTADLEGTWHFNQIVTDGAASMGWSYGTLDVDADGNITAGSYTNFDISTGTFLAGTLTLDSTGQLTGLGTSFDGFTTTTFIIIDGKLDPGKTSGFFVLLDLNGGMVFAHMAKTGVVFSTSDLDGTWHFYQMVSPGTLTPLADCIYGTLEVAGGNITGGTYTYGGGASGAVTGGSLTSDGDGLLAGSAILDGVLTFTVDNGKLDQGKTLGALVLTELTNPYYGLSCMMKGGGTFSTSDLAGTWDLYQMMSFGAGGAAWVYGTVTIDSSGNITEGKITGWNGQSQPINPDTISINSAGLVTGTMTDGGILKGKLDQGKTSGVIILDNVSKTEVALIYIIKSTPAPVTDGDDDDEGGCFISTVFE